LTSPIPFSFESKKKKKEKEKRTNEVVDKAKKQYPK